MLELLTRPAALMVLLFTVLAACNDDGAAVDTDGDGAAEVTVETD